MRVRVECEQVFEVFETPSTLSIITEICKGLRLAAQAETRDRQRQRQTESQTDRDRQRQTETDRDRVRQDRGRHLQR